MTSLKSLIRQRLLLLLALILLPLLLFLPSSYLLKPVFEGTLWKKSINTAQISNPTYLNQWDRRPVNVMFDSVSTIDQFIIATLTNRQDVQTLSHNNEKDDKGKTDEKEDQKGEKLSLQGLTKNALNRFNKDEDTATKATLKEEIQSTLTDQFLSSPLRDKAEALALKQAEPLIKNLTNILNQSMESDFLIGTLGDQSFLLKVSSNETVTLLTEKEISGAFYRLDHPVFKVANDISSIQKFISQGADHLNLNHQMLFQSSEELNLAPTAYATYLSLGLIALLLLYFIYLFCAPLTSIIFSKSYPLSAHIPRNQLDQALKKPIIKEDKNYRLTDDYLLYYSPIRVHLIPLNAVTSYEMRDKHLIIISQGRRFKLTFKQSDVNPILQHLNQKQGLPLSDHNVVAQNSAKLTPHSTPLFLKVLSVIDTIMEISAILLSIIGFIIGIQLLGGAIFLFAVMGPSAILVVLFILIASGINPFTLLS